ncbi:MAG: hypothetical protein KGJ74_03070 [Betaproteobacteria bacterium]|nr:hypothetical protein [Betaproteobacteria bacterium]
MDLGKRVAFLPTTKNGRSRHVLLSSRAVRVIVSTNSSRPGCVLPIGIVAMEAVFSRAARRADLGSLHFHDLCHTATSRIARRLPNIIELASVTGQAWLQILKRYFRQQVAEITPKLD